MRTPLRKPHSIELGDIKNWVESSEYVIHSEGGNYIAVNGQTGAEDSRSTNPSTVIQYALDNTTTGKITVNTDLTQTVALTPVDNVILDFTNHLVTLSGNANFLTMTQKSHFILENVRLTVPDSYTGNIIELNCTTGTCRYNTFRNIWCDNVNSATQHGYNGIQLNITSTGNIFRNSFKNMWFRGVDTGIEFDLDNTNSWANGNYFENIFIDRYVEIMDFDIFNAAANGANRNMFNHVSGQTYSYSTDGFKDIRNTANHFINCTVYDWAAAEAGNNDWSIHADGTNTYIMNNDALTDISDGGSNTFLGHYGNNIELGNINQTLNRNLALFQGTTGNPWFYIYGWDTAAVKYVKMRVSALGHFQMTHHQGGSAIQLCDDGILDLNEAASGNVELFKACGTDENMLLEVSGRNNADDDHEELTLQWGDGTHEDGEIKTTSGDLRLTPTGVLRFGTKTGTGDVTVDGYVTIKDAAGNTIKLATVA